MTLEFLWTVIGSIFFSIAAASLFWKHNHMIRGYIAVLMMIVLGVVMLLLFQWIHPDNQMMIPVIKTLYNLCLTYFVLQWFWSLNYVKNVSNINPQEELD